MYPILEDSLFLSEVIEKQLKKIQNKEKTEFKILDLGCGSCIQAITSKKLGFSNILCADINTSCIKKAKKLGFKTIKSNLFSNINKKFNLIIFNTPYLPLNKYDKEKDTSGGLKGDETIIQFLKQAKKYLEKEGKILILFSSLTPKKQINKTIKQDYIKEEVYNKNLFFEKLFVLVLKKKKKIKNNN